MLVRSRDVHRYGTRSAGVGIYLSTRDHRLVGYRVPKEWGSLTDEQRGVGSLATFRKGLRAGFLEVYGVAVCMNRGCFVCREGRDRGRAGD